MSIPHHLSNVVTINWHSIVLHQFCAHKKYYFIYRERSDVAGNGLLIYSLHAQLGDGFTQDKDATPLCILMAYLGPFHPIPI